VPKVTEFHAAVSRALSSVAPRCLTLDVTTSTNDEARRLGRDGAPHLATVVANQQTSGRGRLGRAWEADAGASLLMSWVARPTLALERWTLLPLLAGVASAEAVEARTGIAAVLKWPNDLMVDDAKLGGILVEAELPSFAVVGVGINVNQTSFPPDLNATSIAICGGLRLDRADLAAAMLKRFVAALDDVEGAMARYRARCATLGRQVRVQRTLDTLIGTAEAVADDGALIVDGTRVAAGDVVHLRPVG
jgi:BirA family transcriptional regulator, biotin operon repressor / biotin---[acetyl-CoA-carboxylase] ligase